MARWVFLVCALALTLLAPRVSLACSCVCVPGKEPSNKELKRRLREAVQAEPIIFLGRVIDVSPDLNDPEMKGVPPEYANRVATLEVIREWKGVGLRSYRLRTSCCGASCGYDFRVGQVQLWFINRDRHWTEGSCCPDPSKAEVRRFIRALDDLTDRPKLELPPELR
jgi:hypothetical protein